MFLLFHLLAIDISRDGRENTSRITSKIEQIIWKIILWFHFLFILMQTLF